MIQDDESFLRLQEIGLLFKMFTAVIKLQFIAADDIVSKIIRYYSHGPASHVDTILEDGRLLGARSDVVMDIPAGVQIRPPDYAKWTKKIVVELECDRHIHDAYYGFLYSQLGKPYDKCGLLYSFIFDRDWRGNDSWFCSELVARGLEKSGFFKYPLAEHASKVTPDDLLMLCSVFTNIEPECLR